MIAALLSLLKPKSAGEIVQRSLGDYSERVIRGLNLSEEAADTTGRAVREFFGSGELPEEGLDEAQKAMLTHVREQFHKAGTMYSEEAITAMQSNYKATENLFGGLSSATETTSGNLLLQSMQEGGLMGLGMGALLGAGGAAVTGGDAGEGAMIGGLVGFGAGSIARGLAKSASSIEDSMMRRLLGDNYDKLGQKSVTTPGEVTPGMRLEAARKAAGNNDVELFGYSFTRNELSEVTPRQDISPMQMNYEGDVMINQHSFLGGSEDNVASYVPETSGNFKTVFLDKRDNKLHFIDESELKVAAATTNVEVLGVNEARQARLQAVRSMSDDQLNKVSGGRAMQKRLTSNKEDSLLTQSRTLTMAGAFLGGVAFTPKKNDHRRGFNKNRGNRI